jgi:hypothetical protein
MSSPHAQERSPGSDTEGTEEVQRQVSPRPQQRRRRPQQQTQKRKQQGGGGPLGDVGLDNLALDTVGDTAKGVTGGVTNTLGNVAGGALDKQGKGGDDKKSDTLRLRLDLNLDIEITLKARIHGDLELALL